MARFEHGVDVILEDGLWMRAERSRILTDARICGEHIHWHVLEVPAEEPHRRMVTRNTAPYRQP